MIQRIQTVYLVLGVALLGASPFVGSLTAQPAASYSWFVPAVGATVGLALLTGLVAVFLYANRKRQRTVVYVAQLGTVLAVAVGFAGRKMAAASAEAVDATGWLLLLLPAVAYVLFWLARRAIERDIELVRSMDRLR